MKEVTLESLELLKKEWEDLKLNMQSFKTGYDNYIDCQNKEKKLEKKYWREHLRYESIHRYDHDRDLKKLITKFEDAKDENLFNFSPSFQPFVRLSKKGFEYHISFVLRHFREYDMQPLMKRAEEISGMKLIGWCISAQNYINTKSDILFMLTFEKKN